MLSLQRDSRGWCRREGLRGPGRQTFPAELDQASGSRPLHPKSWQTPRWRSGMPKRGDSQLSSIARLLSMNAGCRIAFLLLNYVLLGPVGSVTSLSVRPRRSEASWQVFGRSNLVLLWSCCRYQGMQSPVPSQGTGGSCYQAGVLVFPLSAPALAQLCPWPVTLVPRSELSSHPRSSLVRGPSALLKRRWVKCVLVCCLQWDL